MKKLNFFLLTALLLLGVSNVWGSTSITVYYAIPASGGSAGTYTNVYLNMNLGKTTDSWTSPVPEMTNTGKTYDGLNVYSLTFTAPEDGVKTMQFQRKNNGTWVDQQEPIKNWTNASDINNKMYIHDIGFHSYYYVRGSWDSYTGNILFDDGVEITLEAGAVPDFKIVYIEANGNLTYFGIQSDLNHDMYSNKCSNWGFTTASGNTNCWIHTTIAGEYTFDWNNPSSNHLTVTYPDTYLRTGLSSTYGTVCMPVRITSIEGASLYSIHSYNAGRDGVIIAAVTPGADVATEGVPYIYKLDGSSSSITLRLDNAHYYGTAQSVHGLVGTYSDIMINESGTATDLYVLTNSQLLAADQNCVVGANRAYIDIDGIPAYDANSLPAPGRYIEVPMNENNATTLENAESTEDVVKFFENGELRIRRNGVTYDAVGRQVK